MNKYEIICESLEQQVENGHISLEDAMLVEAAIKIYQ